jgi:hypothetical protein
LGIAVYKAVYGSFKQGGLQPQTTGQPIKGNKQAPLPMVKPVVILGEPLTDEEWEMLKNASHVMN